MDVLCEYLDGRLLRDPTHMWPMVTGWETMFEGSGESSDSERAMGATAGGRRGRGASQPASVGLSRELNPAAVHPHSRPTSCGAVPQRVNRDQRRACVVCRGRRGCCVRRGRCCRRRAAASVARVRRLPRSAEHRRRLGSSSLLPTAVLMLHRHKYNLSASSGLLRLMDPSIARSVSLSACCRVRNSRMHSRDPPGPRRTPCAHSTSDLGVVLVSIAVSRSTPAFNMQARPRDFDENYVQELVDRAPPRIYRSAQTHAHSRALAHPTALHHHAAVHQGQDTRTPVLLDAAPRSRVCFGSHEQHPCRPPLERSTRAPRRSRHPDVGAPLAPLVRAPEPEQEERFELVALATHGVRARLRVHGLVPIGRLPRRVARGGRSAHRAWGEGGRLVLRKRILG